MLGPFFDRHGIKITPKRWQQLVSEDGYSDVAITRFPSLLVVVKTRWLGHDSLANLPPKIFCTRALGDPDVAEINTTTEEEALAIHGALCARYRDQMVLMEDGGAPLLTRGVL